MSQPSHSFLTDPPFPEPMCKNHPERPATGIMAYRWCDECHENAKRNYAEQHERSYPINPRDERSTDGRAMWPRTTKDDRNDV